MSSMGLTQSAKAFLSKFIPFNKTIFFVNPNVTDQGALTGSILPQSVADICVYVGVVKKATIKFNHYDGDETIYLLDTPFSMSAYPNIMLDFDNGAVIDQVTGDETLTLYNSKNIIFSGCKQITSKDMIIFTTASKVDITIWGNDTNAIQYAGNSILSSGGTVIIPEGDYTNLSAKISWSTGKKFSLIGSGRGLTNLTWAAGATGGGGIQITYTDEHNPPNVKGLSLFSNDLAVGTALRITGPAQPPTTSVLKGATISNLELTGYDVDADAWLIGLHVENLWYPVVSDLHIKGMTTDILQMTDAIRVDSCMVPRFRAITIFHTEVGIYQYNEYGEELTIEQSTIVGCQYGIVLNNTTTAGGGGIFNCHINTYINNVKMTNRHGFSIFGNYFFKTSYSNHWIGVNIIGGGQNHVSNNTFQIEAGSTNSNTGIQLSGASTENNVNNNVFEGWTVPGYGIYVTGTVSDSTFVDNRGHTGVTGAILCDSSGTGNIFKNNTPTNFQALAANDTTPSVANDLCGQWFTQNSNPTAITFFDDGYISEIITVLVNDAITRFDHGYGLILQGSANYSAPNGAILTFRYDGGGIWREISRTSP